MRTVLGPAKDAPDVRLNGPFLPVHLLAWVVNREGRVRRVPPPLVRRPPLRPVGLLGRLEERGLPDTSANRLFEAAICRRRPRCSVVRSGEWGWGKMY